MRKRLGLMVVMVAVIMMGFLMPVQADEAVPVAVVENDSYDFGAVYEGVDVVHDFIIQNKGDADLEITDVKSG